MRITQESTAKLFVLQLFHSSRLRPDLAQSQQPLKRLDASFGQAVAAQLAVDRF